MSEGAPGARKAQELIDRLKTLGDDDAPNEWALRRLANDARSLMHADRNLSTTLRHRRLRFTEQSLLLWIWQVG